MLDAQTSPLSLMHILQPATRTEARTLTHVESFWVCSQRWAAWDENSKLSIDATLRLSRCGVDKARWASVWLTFYCSNKHTVKMVTVRCLLNNQSRVICLSFYTEIKLESFFFVQGTSSPYVHCKLHIYDPRASTALWGVICLAVLQKQFNSICQCYSQFFVLCAGECRWLWFVTVFV